LYKIVWVANADTFHIADMWCPIPVSVVH